MTVYCQTIIRSRLLKLAIWNLPVFLIWAIFMIQFLDCFSQDDLLYIIFRNCSLTWQHFCVTTKKWLNAVFFSFRQGIASCARIIFNITICSPIPKMLMNIQTFSHHCIAMSFPCCCFYNNFLLLTTFLCSFLTQSSNTLAKVWSQVLVTFRLLNWLWCHYQSFILQCFNCFRGCFYNILV